MVNDMSPGTDASVHRQLGEISATLHALQDSIKRVEDAARRADDKSTESRAAVHKRMDDLVDSVGNVETGLAGAQRDITDMKPITEDVRKWKLMGIGALGVVGIGGMAIGVTMAGVFQKIIQYIKGM